MVHALVFAAAASLYASLNQERLAHGLPALRVDTALSDAARDHADDMARNHYFDHVSPQGVTPWDRMRAHDCIFTYAGENIALASSEPQADHALWNSPPHRANILSSHFTRIGIAAVRSDDGRLFFVEDFAG
jgi:uncharacterized protein YkwD